MLKNLAKRSDRTDDCGWLGKLKKDFDLYLEISMATAYALTRAEDRRFSSDYGVSSCNIRKANLLRHQYVAWPLLNYTNYEGNLTGVLDLSSLAGIDLDNYKVSLSPRFLHESEKYLFHLLQRISAGDQLSSIPSSYVGSFVDSSTGIDIRYSNIKSYEFVAKDFLTLAIANMKVSESNITASYKPDTSPNMCYSRQTELFKLLNMAETEKCDLLVLPEVSVPYYWLPFMVNHAKRSQIGLVFGLEHWIVAENRAYNLLVTVLPYRRGDFKACHVSVRNKNHFAPAEDFDLKRYGYTPQSENAARYDVFNWGDIDFTVFNCFELTNVEHRAVFRGRVDLLINVEYNKDTSYYSDLAGSTARDLHCYVVMVNSSDYGDSRILAPSNSQTREIVRVKGGENLTLLKAELDIKSLRDFQAQSYSPEDKRFKPKPAGFERKCRNVNPYDLDFDDISDGSQIEPESREKREDEK